MSRVGRGVVAIEESFASCAQKINLFASCTFHLLFAQYARKSRFQRLNIDWMNAWAHEWITEWMNSICMQGTSEREEEWDRLQPVRGCSVRRSYLSSYQLRSLHTHISTLCVRVCVNWQLVGNWNGWAVCVCIGSLQAAGTKATQLQFGLRLLQWKSL